jgi:hypothetical protein
LNNEIRLPEIESIFIFPVFNHTNNETESQLEYPARKGLLFCLSKHTSRFQHIIQLQKLFHPLQYTENKKKHVNLKREILCKIESAETYIQLKYSDDISNIIHCFDLILQTQYHLESICSVSLLIQYTEEIIY